MLLMMHQKKMASSRFTIFTGIFFIWGKMQRLFGGSLLHVTHRIFLLHIRKAVNLFINLVFFPGTYTFLLIRSYNNSKENLNICFSLMF